MKKEYINPSIEIVKISTVQMLAGSPDLVNEDASKDVNGDYNDSRGYGSVWDDDEY